MKSEAQYRSKVVRWLAPLLAFPVENSAHPGAPDICTLAGWIEMKRAFVPADPSEIVPIEVRPNQLRWAKSWKKHGGRSFVLVVCDTGQWLLFDQQFEILGLCTMRFLYQIAYRTYPNKNDAKINLANHLMQWRPR